MPTNINDLYYNTIREVKSGLKEYIEFYNHKRLHQSLDYKIPMDIYQSNNDGSNKEAA